MSRSVAILLLAAALGGCFGGERPASVSAPSGYAVRAGDTLTGIAARNGVTLSALARANGIAPPYLIRVGQRLAIPRRDAVVQPRPAPVRVTAPTPTAPTPTVPVSTPAPRLVWPADGPVAENFGSGADPRGVALATLSGTAVRAAAAGTVLFAGTEPKRFGQLVLVDHGGGWVTAYGHLARLVVRTGEKVAPGSRLGFTGGKGNDARLHFELRKDNQPRDPLPLLPPRF